MKKITLIDIILIILFLFAVVLVLWYLFGNSPTIEQIIVGFMLPIAFGIAIKLSIISTRLDYIEKNIRDGFNRIKEDVYLIRKEIKK